MFINLRGVLVGVVHQKPVFVVKSPPPPASAIDEIKISTTLDSLGLRALRHDAILSEDIKVRPFISTLSLRTLTKQTSLEESLSATSKLIGAGLVSTVKIARAPAEEISATTNITNASLQFWGLYADVTPDDISSSIKLKKITLETLK